jgi:hypothetical protein
MISTLFVLSAAACDPLLSPDSSAQSEIRLTLIANPDSTQVRAFVFVAEITGGADNEPSLYCQATTWDFGDGPGLTVTPSCVPYSPETRITRRFETKHTYAKAGTYEATLVYGPLRAQRSVEVP